MAFSAFQANAFQRSAYQIIGSARDTHDGWIPDHAIRKFYENERLKHSKVIQTYKKLVKAEEEVKEIKAVLSEYTADTSKLTRSVLDEIAEDKVELAKFLTLIDTLEKRLLKYKQDAEDDDILLMIAAAL